MMDDGGVYPEGVAQAPTLAFVQPLRGRKTNSNVVTVYPGCAARPWANECDPFGVGYTLAQVFPATARNSRYLRAECKRRVVLPHGKLAQPLRHAQVGRDRRLHLLELLGVQMLAVAGADHL